MMHTNNKKKIVLLLKGIETKDPESVLVVNEEDIFNTILKPKRIVKD
jgi:hypothetical protein